MDLESIKQPEQEHAVVLTIYFGGRRDVLFPSGRSCQEREILEKTFQVH